MMSLTEEENTSKDSKFSYYEYNDNDQILNDRYIKVHNLNNGSYGNITLARDLKTSELVAIKYYYTLSDSSDSDDSNSSDIYPKGDVDNCLYEYNILKTLHNNITAKDTKHNTVLVDSVINAVDQFDAYLVMDYCSHGDLYDAIRNETIPRSSKMLFHLTNQLANCLEFIHINGVYHRDIKPENILIHDITTWQLKLTDFGLATIDASSSEKDIGSERYMAPELFLYDEDELCNLDTDNDEFFSSANNNATYESDKVDIWGLGITFLNIVFHKNPFEIAKPNMDKIFKYYCYNREAILDIFDIMTLSFYKLIVSCLQLNPSDRNFATIKTLLRSCKEFTFDDYLYNSTEDSLYKDVFVEGWDEVSIDDQNSKILSPPTPPSIIDNKDKEEPIIPYNPVDINTKHYETAGDVLLKYQKQGGIANSWKAKNLNKLNKFKRSFEDQKYKYYNNNNEGFNLNHYKFNDKNRRNNFYNSSNHKTVTAHSNKDHRQDSFFTRKPLGIPKPNKHILKYNENSPKLHYTNPNSFKNSVIHHNNSHKPMSFKSSYNSHSNSLTNSYNPNQTYITKNGIKNTHYNRNFNHYMNIQHDFKNNNNSNSDYSQEEDIKNSSNEDDFDLDSDFNSESFENNNNGKFQTAHEYMKVQQSLKHLSESRKNTYKSKNPNSNLHNGALSQPEDDDILFTLEEDEFGVDDSSGTISAFAHQNFTENFEKIDINNEKHHHSIDSNFKSNNAQSFDEDDLPDLLKSPVSSYHDYQINSENGGVKKQKNVYVSPANRRNSNTLNTGVNPVLHNNKRKSISAGNNLDINNALKNGRNIQSSPDIFHFKKFNRPSFINSLTSKPTLSINKKHMDVFSENDDDDDDEDSSVIPFSQRNGRKSVNEEIINMEDYKNNWLSLQLEND